MAAKCGGYWLWTDECRKAGCEDCGTMEFAVSPPKDCTCATVLAGFVFIATRNESCPIHGRCQCGNGPSRYDDHRECDYYPRQWSPKCPLISHRQ